MPICTLPSGQELFYELTCKKIKNINLHIRPDGGVWVSAPKRVSVQEIEKFLSSKESWIIQTRHALQQRQAEREHRKPLPNIHEESVFFDLFAQVYEDFAPLLNRRPQLKLRKMKSRWGSCNPVTYVVTLNRELLKAERESIEYVLIHEFVHFLHPNHSKAFYACLESYLPDHKLRKKGLKQQNIL